MKPNPLWLRLVWPFLRPRLRDSIDRLRAERDEAIGRAQIAEGKALALDQELELTKGTMRTMGKQFEILTGGAKCS